MKTAGTGTVYLTGAGPGDERLITLRARDCLAQADVVIYDYLANPGLLRLCGDITEKIYVGKQAGRHTMNQDEINALIVDKAKQGNTIVRLKGGDPCMFGRGGEEALACREAGVPFEFIPGITAGIAAPAYAGIPVTHRGLAVSAAFITGHEKHGKAASGIKWDKIATGIDTLVFYMGVKNLPDIVSNLKANGRSGDTPAVVIRWGTTAEQETVEGTLDTIEQEILKRNIAPPAMIIVGEVVSLRKNLQWFDTKPLYGKTIVVTRSRTQASELVKGLQELGARVIELPTIDIHPVKDFSTLDNELRRITEYSWIVFTSVNGVELFFHRLRANNMDARDLMGCSCAVIGSATAEKLDSFGIIPDLIPGRFTSEGTVEAFARIKTDYSGEKVLLPGSSIARDYIPKELRRMGAEVTAVPVYETVRPAYTKEEIQEIMEGKPDLVTFSSSSTAAHFADILTSLDLQDYLPGIAGGSIGPVTSNTAREMGIPIALEAGNHTIPGLIETIRNYFDTKDKV